MNVRLFSLLLAMAAWLPGQAFAACTSPSGTPGDQMYNNVYNIMQYCNGSVWVNMSSIAPGAFGSVGALTNGDLCTSDGTAIDCTTSTLLAANFPALRA